MADKIMLFCRVNISWNAKIKSDNLILVDWKEITSEWRRATKYFGVVGYRFAGCVVLLPARLCGAAACGGAGRGREQGIMTAT